VVTLAVLAIAVTCGSGVAGAQRAGGAQKGAVERIKVRGMALEGNLSGDAPVREVTVYLPPGYSSQPYRRYPTLYMLHGYTDSDSQWMGLEKHWINLAEVVDKALAGGETREMIVVMPNAYTRFQGSMYSNSVTTGNWESFVADELVAYIDSHYRTIRQTASRGLAGHSMGGYGALRIGMKNPAVFSSLYLLNPCCLAPRRGGSGPAEGLAQVEAVRSMEDFNKASFGVKATFASAAAWAPNPNNPPFYLDLPFKDGEPRPEILAKFAANAPLAMIDQYIENLRKFKAIGFDAGSEERGIAPTVSELHGVLDTYKIPHQYEIYEGNHTNRVGERIESKMLPFFTRNLAFDPQ
jgi:enterochelin esterase-like enzyme